MITPEEALTHQIVTVGNVMFYSVSTILLRKCWSVQRSYPPRSFHGIENVPCSSGGAGAAAVIEATCTDVEEPAVSQGAVTPAEETSANGRSHDEGVAAKVQWSQLKRIWKFFGMAIRTSSRMKRRMKNTESRAIPGPLLSVLKTIGFSL